jgi:hypothetical protein
MAQAPVLDDFMLRLAPQPPVAVDPSLLRARKSISQALDELSRIGDAALEKPWPWRGEEADVRYGLYRQYEALEDIRARVAPLIGESLRSQSPARPLVGAATAARWDLHGLLVGLSDAELDRDPANGEWTARQTLAHIVNGQRAYGWYTAWWLARRDAPPDDFPPRIPDDVAKAANLPAEETEAEGSLPEVRARLDEILDLAAGVFAPLGDDELAARARWAGIAVDIRFRVGRWASHLREHTIQTEKTLAMIDRPLSEVERLVRLIAAAWGRLEADLYMWPLGDRSVADALARAEEATAGVAADAASVRLSAG